MNLHEASSSRLKWATIVTFFTIPISGLMTDVYLPSFPAMSDELGVPQSSIQLSLTCFLFSYGLCQIFVGSLLDSLGRHKLVLASLATLVLSSVGIALTQSIAVICALRVLQGVATSFVVVAKRAYFVDVYEGERRKHFLSYFTIVWSCGPVLAPFFGGYIEKTFHWQMNFYFMALYGAALLAGEVLVGGETIRRRKPFNLSGVVRDYVDMLGNRIFTIGLVVLGLSYSAVLIFNLSAPFIIEQQWNYSAVTIGICTLLLGLAWMLGGIVSRPFMRADFNRKITSAVLLQALFILTLLVLSLFEDNLYVLMGCAFPLTVCSGFLFTNFFTHNLLIFPENVGIAGGLIGGLVHLIVSAVGFVITSLGQTSTINDMAWQYLALSMVLAVIIVWSFGRKIRRAS